MPQDDPAAVSTAAQHTSPEEAGRVFAVAKPGLAAHTRLVLVTRPSCRRRLPSRSRWRHAATAMDRWSWEGPTRFVIAASGVRVQRWAGVRQAYAG